MSSNTYPNEQELKSIVHQLATDSQQGSMCHVRYGNEPLPSPDAIHEIVALCRQLLFPGFFGAEQVNSYNLEYIIGLKCERLKTLLESQIVAALLFVQPCDYHPCADMRAQAQLVATRLIAALPALRRVLQTDVEAIYNGDPAVTHIQEVIYCYPSIKAIINYRIAHELLLADVPILPRMISELAHSETGIDIHPAAQIGHHFAMDHGTGVVIGATAIIGNHVKLYQGVTLGALSFDLDEGGNPVKGVPRHPIIGNHVVIYSNASVLGRITVGDGAIIGGNIWVTTNVAAGEKIVQGAKITETNR